MARAVAVADAEVPAEADRLAGFLHPRDTPELFGHASAQAEFRASLRSDRLHHAWLVTGAEGIGKATLAYRLAVEALGYQPAVLFGAADETPRDMRTVRQVRALSHPGLMLLRRTFDIKAKRFTSAITVDEVRRLRPFLAHSGQDEGYRVVIVDTAGDLNLSAANALLKSLEEPPPRTVFLVLAEAPGRLLATIRSRCRTLALAPLGDGDLSRAIAQAYAASEQTLPSGEDIAAMSAIAEGSVRRALTLLGGGGGTLMAKIDRVFALLPKLDVQAAHALADELQPAAAEQKFELFLDLFDYRLAGIVRAAATGTGDHRDIATAGRLIGPGRLATFAELWEILSRDRADCLALNLDRKSLILSILSRLEIASRR